jgi:hypothetical protein
LDHILDSAGYLPSNLVSSQQEVVILDELDEVDMSYYDKIIFAN